MTIQLTCAVSGYQYRYGSEAFSFGNLVKAVTAHFQTKFHYDEVSMTHIL
jgi:hypothetical protein